jgi:hypothetical protein
MHKIFDDLLPSALTDRIEGMLMSRDFSWFALDNLSLGDQEEKYKFTYKDNYRYIETYGMSSLIYKDDHWYDPYSLYMMVRQIIDYVVDKEGIEYNRILRVKANFLTQNVDHSFDEMCINFPHLDNYNDHKVLVYYVNDSDGDTVLFNEQFDPEHRTKTEPIELTTEARVQPKKGRILMFDGLQYHTSQNPINSKHRCIININIA